ncbi:hypothetical protein C8Q80DRAFT_896263 [Daedaleopsis nitida]|nr:hypothetical protein C8Q80DRAFT_896263 [Daedaleopsis nitida]
MAADAALCVSSVTISPHDRSHPDGSRKPPPAHPPPDVMIVADHPRARREASLLQRIEHLSIIECQMAPFGASFHTVCALLSLFARIDELSFVNNECDWDQSLSSSPLFVPLLSTLSTSNLHLQVDERGPTYSGYRGLCEMFCLRSLAGGCSASVSPFPSCRLNPTRAPFYASKREASRTFESALFPGSSSRGVTYGALRLLVSIGFGMSPYRILLPTLLVNDCTASRLCVGSTGAAAMSLPCDSATQLPHNARGESSLFALLQLEHSSSAVSTLMHGTREC